jgi:hypothetical protein
MEEELRAEEGSERGGHARPDRRRDEWNSRSVLWINLAAAPRGNNNTGQHNNTSRIAHQYAQFIVSFIISCQKALVRVSARRRRNEKRERERGGGRVGEWENARESER